MSPRLIRTDGVFQTIAWQVLAMSQTDLNSAVISNVI